MNYPISGLNFIPEAALKPLASSTIDPNQGKAFASALNQEKDTIQKQTNNGLVLKISHKYLSTQTKVNNAAYLPDVQNILKSLEEKTLTLRALVGKEGLVNLEDIEELKEYQEDFNPSGKIYASCGYSILDIIPELQSLEHPEEAESLLEEIDNDLTALLGHVNETDLLSGQLGGLPLGLNPEVMAFQLQSQLTNTLLDSLFVSDTDQENNQNDLSQSILGGQSGGQNGQDFLAQINKLSPNPNLNLGTDKLF